MSNVPGGVGVFESVLLLLLRSVPADQLLGALLAYRAIYYFAPFAIALALLGAHELWVHRGARWCASARLGAHLARARSRRRPSRSPCSAPGAVLLFSGATPGLGATACDLLRRVRASAGARAVAPARQRGGVGLLVLAHGLYRRLDAAWWLTHLAAVRRHPAVAAQGLRLRRGHRFSALVVVVLVSARGRFRRRASLIEQRFSARGSSRCSWCSAPPLWLVVFAYRTRAVQQGPVVAIRVRGAGAAQPARHCCSRPWLPPRMRLWRLLRPSRPPLRPPSPEDLAQAAQVIAANRRSDRESCAARRQEPDVQRRAYGLHHVSGLGQQLGCHGRPRGSAGAS